jgi:hypothetical protein
MNCTGFESKSHNLIEVVPQYLPGETERNVEDLSLGQDRWLSGQDSNGGPPEYMSKSVVNTPVCSVNGEVVSFSVIKLFYRPHNFIDFTEVHFGMFTLKM